MTNINYGSQILEVEVARMYVETIKSVKQSKTYYTYLVRESYRENGKVKHRTIANISKLPMNLIIQIKNHLSGNKGNFDLNSFNIGSTYEFGCSYAFYELAKEIGLDKIIYSRKEQWRENILAMIVGRIAFQGSKLSLVNVFKDTALWELAGHKLGERPDVEKDCYQPMDRLLERKSIIEKKLATKHLRDGCMILYDLTNTWLEGEYVNSEIVTHCGKPKGGKKGYKAISIGLLATKEGCPVGIEIFKGSTSDQMTVYEEIKKLSTSYGLKELIFVGDRGLLTSKRIDEVNEENFKTITALTHSQINNLIKSETISPSVFEAEKIIELCDVNDKSVRYILCKSQENMFNERATRESLIKKVSDELSQKASVKRKRDKKATSASIGKIFGKYKIEKFFDWNVDDNGVLTWSLKDEIIEKEKQLDGCYIIRTEVPKELLSKEEVIQGYRNLQKVEQGFKNMKTVLLELRPIYHKTDDRIKSHVFITMLAYYLQWHAKQRLKSLFDNDKEGSSKRWDFSHVIERLKSIRKIEFLLDGIVVKTGISTPDEEQKEILNLLSVKLP